MFFFYSKDCDHCQYAEEFILEPLMDKYLIKVKGIDIDNTGCYEILLKMQKSSGTTGSGIPVIFIGDTILSGDSIIF
jgi:glutaredoxin